MLALKNLAFETFVGISSDLLRGGYGYFLISSFLFRLQSLANRQGQKSDPIINSDR